MPILLALALLAQDRKPNVVLVITDDQGYGDLGRHGNETIRTPRLDAFAAESARVERFYVQPVCSPTRACLLTGRYNYRTGVVDTFIGRSLMHPDERTLAELLKDAGWRTGHFGKWHLGDNPPLRSIDQGFEEAVWLRGGGLGQPSDPPGGERYQDPILFRNGVPEKRRGYVSDLITDDTIAFARANKDRPFFAYVAYNAPHTPLELPPDARLDPALDDVTAKVYAMVENIDRNVGRILDALRELAIDRDTIFIFMTDNGPQQKRYNAGLRGLKASVFEGGLRVPFYVRWPARLKPGSVKGPGAHIDVLPSVLEACGVEAPKNLDGRSLLPQLAGAAFPARTLFFQWHRGDAPEPGRSCAAIESRWKWARPGAPKDPAMLFDLEADPNETKDVAAEHPKEVERLAAAYDAWFKDVSSTRGFAPPRIRLGTQPLDVLTRQDWRGPKAGWGKDSAGHWEVEAEPGEYEVTIRPEGRWTLTWNGEPLPEGRVKLAGPGAIGAGAVQFLELRKVR